MKFEIILRSGTIVEADMIDMDMKSGIITVMNKNENGVYEHWLVLAGDSWLAVRRLSQ